MANLSQLIDDYLAGPANLRKAVAGMSREQLLAHPVAGKWSTLEVVAHLADFDPILAMRMKSIIAEDKPQLLAADENRFAAALAYQDRDLEEELAIIDARGRRCAHPPQAAGGGVAGRRRPQQNRAGDAGTIPDDGGKAHHPSRSVHRGEEAGAGAAGGVNPCPARLVFLVGADLKKGDSGRLTRLDDFPTKRLPWSRLRRGFRWGKCRADKDFRRDWSCGPRAGRNAAAGESRGPTTPITREDAGRRPLVPVAFF